MADIRYVFIVEWYDIASSILKKFQLTYFPNEKSIDIFDLKNQKTFLKKCVYLGVNIDDFYIGSVLLIHSRQFKIIDFADVFTKQKFESRQEKTFAMIKPDSYMHIGKILSATEKDGFLISNLRMTQMTIQDAQNFYAEHQGKPFYDGLVKQMSSDLIVGMELVAENSIKKWRTLIGPTDPKKAREQAPQSIRALYGQEGPKNVVHGSDSTGSADRELKFFFSFNSSLKCTASFINCSLCIIKPHILQSRQAGQIVDLILQAGFEIRAMQIFYLDRPTSVEFFDVYKGVLPEYVQLAEHLTSGPSLILEVRQEDVVKKFRDLCGPHDPQIAKELRPNTIRALFGIDRVKNAVHCTDLPEDGVLEVEYFFKVLMQQNWRK